MPAAIGRLAIPRAPSTDSTSPESIRKNDAMKIGAAARNQRSCCRSSVPAERYRTNTDTTASSEREHCPEPRPVAAGKQRELDLDGLVCPGNARQRARPEGSSQPHHEQRGSGEPGDGTEAWGGQLPGRKQQEEKRSERERGDRSQICRQPCPGAARQRARRLSKCIDRVLLAEQCDLNARVPPRERSSRPGSQTGVTRSGRRRPSRRGSKR